MAESSISPEDNIAVALEAWTLSKVAAAVLLAAAKEHGTYGYEVTREMLGVTEDIIGLDADAAGKVVKSNGSIYKRIQNLEDQGLLEPYTPPEHVLSERKPKRGPPRHYRKTTELGRAVLKSYIALSREEAVRFDELEGAT